MVRHSVRNRASSPAVSTLRPPRFKTSPPSQQTPPSAQRPPPSQQQQQQTQTPTVIPSSIPSQQPSDSDPAHDADPIEDFSELEAAETPNNAIGSQTAFQVMASSQRSSGSQRFGGLKQPPKWSDREDAVLMRGIREGWTATQIVRELGTRRTGSAIRGRKKVLMEKYNLQQAPITGPRQLQVESRRRWTPAEMSIIQQAVRDGIGAPALQQKLRDRTLKSIEHKILKRKLVSKDPVRSGATPSASKAKVSVPKASKAKDQFAVFMPQSNTDEMALDNRARDETADEGAAQEDQTMTDDVEEYPAYADAPQERQDAAPVDQTRADDVEEYPYYPNAPQKREEPAITQKDEVEAAYVSMKGDFDFSKVHTAYVRLSTTAESDPTDGHPKPADTTSVKTSPRRATARGVREDVRDTSAPDQETSEPGKKAGRLRRPKAAAKKPTPRRATTGRAQEDIHETSAEEQATAEPAPNRRPTAASRNVTRTSTPEVPCRDAFARDASPEDQALSYSSDSDGVETIEAKPQSRRKDACNAAAAVDTTMLYTSDSDGVETSRAKPRSKRKGLFDDWTDDQRWRDCLRQCGGDEVAARRQLKETSLTAGMYDAILRKDQGAIESIKAERRQMELRDAIEEGRARRKHPGPDASTIAGGGEADEEVLREEDWEIYIEKDDAWSLPSEDHDSDVEIDEDDGVSEDMIRDREFVEIDDDEDEDEDEYLARDPVIAGVDEEITRDREIEEVEDDDGEEIQYEAPPTFAAPRHFTPIQVMQANVVDHGNGLPTPAATNEKPPTFQQQIDAKQPTSSLPTAASVSASVSRDSERSDSKRSRRRSRNATRRRESGSVRPPRTKNAQFRRSMMSEVSGAAPQRASSQALFSDDTDNPFMNIVRNAHIPTPPKSREEPARRRGTPSPPAWFASDKESDDESEEESE